MRVVASVSRQSRFDDLARNQILVSARDLQGNKEHALKAGARAYLQKPWNDDELLAIISQILGQPDLSISQRARERLLQSIEPSIALGKDR